MDTAMLYEIIGYVASALVAISLLMTSIFRLRVINIIGAIVFVIYGVLIGAFPVALVNAIIVLINLYQLAKLLRIEDEFSLLDSEATSSYVRQFIDFHSDEIRQIYPTFFDTPLTQPEAPIVIFILRNMLPVGLFIAKSTTSGHAVIKLDYVIPGYRDFKVGQFLYRQKADIFKTQGINTLISYPGNDDHARYLERMGFKRDFATSERRLYQLQL